MLIHLHNTAAKLAIKPRKKFLIIGALGTVAALWGLYNFLIQSPVDFPSNSIYSIEEKRSLSDISNEAKENKIVKSATALKVLITLFSGNKGAISGDYVLNKKESVFKIAQRFAGGDYRLSVVKVTVPEGLNVYEIGELLSKKDKLKNFNQQEFVSLAKDKEGYLYPDTYFFLPNIKTKQIIETMENNFAEKVASIQNEVKKFGKTFTEVLTMASILEDEVPKTEDRKIVAGILWKRIKIGMPLQVDAVFPYITKKQGSVARGDLKIDSPYNTYINKGLPPGPISNPSLDAILSAINPTETKYLFYISDKKGATRFAATLEEHNNNIEKYLK